MELFLNVRFKNIRLWQRKRNIFKKCLFNFEISTRQPSRNVLRRDNKFKEFRIHSHLKSQKKIDQLYNFKLRKTAEKKNFVED